ncbi:JmjC domain [Ostreococcus tauri]|uniref:JmjC domain n=1 Tax=Ostreococcus tauri TaxID=70448 RepID=A0A090M7H2_OSTTA|nr:JmjC domain [Ostreococcus tauri]CEF98637.1 JmjC domain [Ostreococcus tauri]|eukprot:XP_022839388.1 JmjC domain [Ostreococcus tauri]
MSLDAAIDAADDVLVNHFFPAFGLEVARELRESGENALASDVTSAVLEKDFARAEAIVERLYAELLRSEGSWTSTAHRECYVLAQLRTCVERLRGRGNAEDGRAATRALDMCVILGAPADALSAFVNACELKLGISAIRGAYERRVECGWTFPRESPEPPAMGERRWLERVDAKGLTAKEFRREYFKVDRPVGLVGLGADWPAMRKWDDLRWWSAFHGHRSVPLELGAYDDEGNWRETVKTMHEFVMEDLQPSVSGRSNAVAYLAQHRLVDHLQSLSSDFTVPEFCAKSLERINVWMGTAGTVTPCHFDTYDNLLGQVAGYKLVRLYLESDTPYMYRCSSGSGSGRHAQGNFSAVDVENPDLDRFPEFANATPFDVLLAPGDFVYVPAKTWHHVRAVTASISLNFWF